MLSKLIFLLLFLASSLFGFAGTVKGIVTDALGNRLPYATIEVKDSRKGTTANNEGAFVLELSPGKYTLICQHIGYGRQEKVVTVDEGSITITIQFILTAQELTLEEVRVGEGEDPAYGIIRNAIKKRSVYASELKAYVTEVYTKGGFKLRDHPKKFMGQKVDFEDGDTSKKRMLYLSETVARYSLQPPDKKKTEVLATRVSGQSNGFGFSMPQVVSFYSNNVALSVDGSSRGFVSPVADRALSFYRYKLEGSFFDGEAEVNKIKVIPRRKFEPLFAGYIYITEGTWRIHSLQLELTKTAGLQLLDTIRIEQEWAPLQAVWVVKKQVMYPSIKMFGFDAHGSFLSLFSKYDLAPSFAEGFFNKTILKYEDSSNKQPSSFWDAQRPLALLEEEVVDYRKKDSLEKVQRDPAYLDSLDKKANKLSLREILLNGETISKRSKGSSLHFPALINAINYNTVEGAVIRFAPTYTKRLDSTRERSFSILPLLRYGFSNGHFNASIATNHTWNFGKNRLTFNGGKGVFQFNNAEPVSERANTISTLLYKRNFLKIYEALFISAQYSFPLGDDFRLSTAVAYQNRQPLNNTTDYSWREVKDRRFTPNYPVELVGQNMQKHQAFTTTVTLRWQAGARFIELPGRKISVGSGKPVVTLQYTEAFKGVAGSDTRFGRWQAAVQDQKNLKLLGRFGYRISVGGFLHRDSVALPDLTHFNGNQYRLAAPYLASFQLAPYYRYSNKERFYATAHAEHHFNGLLTNKIPLFRKLGWFLVGGTNAFYVNKQQYYAEAFAGLENIFKIFRVDFIQAYNADTRLQTGIRIGVNGSVFR